MDALDHTGFRRMGKRERQEFAIKKANQDEQRSMHDIRKVKEMARKMEEARKEQRRLLGLV